MQQFRFLRIFIIDRDADFAYTLQNQLAQVFTHEKASVQVFENETACYSAADEPHIVLLGISANGAVESKTSYERLRKNFGCDVIPMLPADDVESLKTMKLYGVSDCILKNNTLPRLVIEKISPRLRQAVYADPNKPAIALPFIVSPSALLALLITSLIGCVMYFTFN